MTQMELPDVDALWDYADPLHTEIAFRQLLPSAEQSGDRSYQLELKTQIARTQGLQGQFAAAHATLDAVHHALTDDLTRPRIRYLLERGRVYNSAGDPVTACAWFRQAWELAQATKGATFYAIDAAHMLGIAMPPDERLAWNLTALHLAEAAPDARSQSWCGSLYNNIGWTYHDQGDFELALAMFQQAVVWQESHQKLRETLIARWCVGRTLRSLHRIEEALALQFALEAAWKSIGTGDQEDGFVSEEIGECLLVSGQPAESQAYFAQAARLLAKDSWFVEHEPERFARLQRLGLASPDVQPTA